MPHFSFLEHRTAMATAVTPQKLHWWQTLKGREALAGYIGISPWLLGFLLWGVGPMMLSAYYSLTEYSILSDPVFRGLDNFERMFTRDKLFAQALRVTAVYAIVTVPLGVIVGYGLALLLNQKARGLSYWRTGFYLPAVVPGVATAYLFAYVFANEYGLADSVLQTIGIEDPPNWFGSTKWALPSLMVLSLWGAGGGLILYLASLQGVPTALYDAAKVDGANAWGQFWNVTIPMTSPVILFTFIMGIINSFQIFTSAFIITQGGPVNSTLFYVLYLYRKGWQQLEMGYAAGLAWILFIIIFALTVLVLRTSSRFVHYEGE